MKVNYVYDTYKKAINFIQSLGGVLPFVFPEYLLTYDDYITFIEQVSPFREDITLEHITPYPRDIFWLRSKQCWIDLLLQTFKIIFLKPIQVLPLPPDFCEIIAVNVESDESNTIYNLSEMSLERESDFTERFDFSNFDHFLKEKSVETKEDNKSYELSDWPSIEKNKLILGSPAAILLQWLESSYNTQLIRLWKNLDDGNVLQERQVKNLDDDLRDGLILLALVSLYCPYLDDRIPDVKFDVSLPENRHHNAVTFLEWLKIVIDVKIFFTPETILNAVALEMLFIVAFLFHYLPTLYPYKTLSLQANINETSMKIITIQNKQMDPIQYKVKFFHNELDSFVVDETNFVIQPKKSHKLKVKYQAKRVQCVKAYLLLNGENQGFRFAQTMPYKLEGEAKFDQCTTTVTLPVIIYNSVEVTLPVQSPYKIQTLYNIYYTVGKVEYSSQVKFLSWKLQKTFPVLPSRINSDSDKLTCDENGVGLLSFKAYCLSEIMRIYTVFFINPEVGDFCMELRISPITNKTPHSILNIEMSEFNLKKCVREKCTCGKDIQLANGMKRNNCPKFMKMLIPCQNDLLWIAVGKIFRVVVDGFKHWKENYCTATDSGSKLLYFAVDNVEEDAKGDIIQLLERNVDYLVHTNTSIVTLPDAITIDDIRKINAFLEVDVHVNINRLQDLKDFTLILTSENLMEKRYYDVKWQLPQTVYSMEFSKSTSSSTNTKDVSSNSNTNTKDTTSESNPQV